MNARAVMAIFNSEMEHFRVTIFQNLASPIITTFLYFLAFGATFGRRIGEVGGVNYTEFLVPGLVLMTALNQAFTTSAWAIFTRRDRGTVYEILAAPVSPTEMTLGFVLPETVKALIVGGVIALTAIVMLRLKVGHPLLFVSYLALTALTFAMLGFLAGLLVKRLPNLQALRMFIVTPMVFLGGIFFEIHMLPSPWSRIAQWDPVVYLASGMRYAMFGHADQPFGAGLMVVAIFIALAALAIGMILKTGYNLRP